MGTEPDSGPVREGSWGGRLGRRAGGMGRGRCWCRRGPLSRHCPQVTQGHIEGPDESPSSPVVTCLSK